MTKIKWKNEKENLRKYLLLGMSYYDISKVYNTTKCSITHAVNRNFNSDELLEIKKLLKINNVKYENSGVSGLPMPLNYSYPNLMTMWMISGISGNITNHIYFPETNRWIMSKKQLKKSIKRLNIFNGKYILWYYKWILKIRDPYNLTQEDIELVINNLYSDKLPKTKEYIRHNLEKDSSFECDFFCIGDDIESEYYRIHDELGFSYNYDFSELKGKIIQTKKSYFTIYCLEIDPISNEVIGKYSTNYEGLILKHLDNFKLKGIKIHTNKMSSTKEFIKRSNNIFGSNSFEILSEYTGIHNPMTFLCKKCGNIFTLPRASDHLYSRSGGCDICNSSKSIGEQITERWLIENNIKYKYNFSVNGEIEGRNTLLVKIDFHIVYKDTIIWIEYNGEQHYIWREFLHKSIDDFNNQLRRDQNVRNYCKDNNIQLIEIPYTYNTYKKVKELLDRVILGGEDINTIIDYSSLYKN